MSNSKLICYTKLSPNCNKPRNHVIDTITIHCMAGNGSIEACGEIFAPVSRQASSNYGIGSDGRIALYVDECNRSWCSGSPSNDHRAITIEVANDGGAPDWHASDKAIAALINLCADICQRNGIKALLWKADKSLIGQVDKQNMTVHRWFAAKACPGDYLYGKHSYIASEVNKRLGNNTASAINGAAVATTAPTIVYRVQVGAFSTIGNAQALRDKLTSAGYTAFVMQSGAVYRVQCGAYSAKVNADALSAKLKAAGYSTMITTQNGTAV